MLSVDTHTEAQNYLRCIFVLFTLFAGPYAVTLRCLSWYPVGLRHLSHVFFLILLILLLFCGNHYCKADGYKKVRKIVNLINLIKFYAHISDEI